MGWCFHHGGLALGPWCYLPSISYLLSIHHQGWARAAAGIDCRHLQHGIALPALPNSLLACEL